MPIQGFGGGSNVSSMTNVLLVADDIWVYNDVVAALGEAGTTVAHIDDPSLLTDTVLDLQPDVAIIDLQVGTKGGMAMARTLREAHALDGAPDVPVVLLLDRSADAFLAKRSAAAAWVLKPFTAAELRSALSKAAAQAAR